MSFKRYPAKYSTHRAIEAAIKLAIRHNLNPDDIQRIEIDYPPTKLVDRPAPRSGLDGKFSLQYGTAAGLLDRKFSIMTFTDKRRFEPDMEALLPRIKLNECKDIPTNFPASWVVVRVYSRQGNVLEERCDKLKGMAGSPHVGKVMQCFNSSQT